MNRLTRPLHPVIAGILLALPIASMSQTSLNAVQHSTEPAKDPSGFGFETKVLTEGGEPQVTLDDLIGVALSGNPAIKSAAEEYQAIQARVPQVRSLPDPTFSGGWMGNITPFSVQHGDPSSYRGLTVAQKFPIPSKLKLRGQIVDREAEAAWWKYEQTRRQVSSEVKVAYYDYFFSTKAIEITKKNRDLLQKLASIAESLYRVGKGRQADVFRAQVEVSRVDQKLIMLTQQLETARARLNTLLYRDPESPMAPPAPFLPAEFNVSLADLYALARQNDPDLEMDRRMIEGDRYAVDLARKAYVPDFGVSYSYEQRPGMPDMHGVMGEINIPIFYRSKQKEGVIESTHSLISAQRGLDDRITQVNFEIKEQYLAATASRELSNLYSKAVVPQSSLALESSMSAYEVGNLDFLSMLTNFVDVLDYEVGYYQELSKFQTSLARMEPLVGTELTK